MVKIVISMLSVFYHDLNICPKYAYVLSMCTYRYRIYNRHSNLLKLSKVKEGRVHLGSHYVEKDVDLLSNHASS